MLAYLDPASGSMIVQGLVAGAAGAAVVGKIGWQKLSSPLRRKKSAVEDETTDVSADPELQTD